MDLVEHHLAGELLESLPGVEECAVVRRRNLAGQEVVVAYVVPSGTFAVEQLREKAEEALPPQFVPTAYVGISALPIAADGTVDLFRLAALPVVDDRLAENVKQILRDRHRAGNASVVVTEAPRAAPVLHASDLVPHRRTATVSDPLSLAKSDDTGQAAENPRPSIRRGAAITSSLPAQVWMVLERAAETHPDHGITYVSADEPPFHQSYPEILEDAERILCGLRLQGLRPGDKVLFQLDRKRDFVAAFWACMLGGFVAAPIAVPPAFDPANAAAAKLCNCWRSLHKPLILTRLALEQEFPRLDDGLADARICSIENLRQNQREFNRHCGSPDDLALLLFTSGSTGKPKGVMLSQANLLARSAGAAQMNGFDASDVTVNWFPLDHVGGIVMYHLAYAWTEARHVEVATEWILEQPLRWLHLIDQYHATTTWAPNFAFGLINDCHDAFAGKRWNLSSMRFVLNGGETIVPATAMRFLDLLAEFELAPDAMKPAWGMSETCSGVLFSHRCRRGKGLANDTFIEVGEPIPGVSVRVVGFDDRVVPEGTIGRLEVSGLAVTHGYWEDPELNAGSFSSDGWFLTGDLALMRGGQVTITGRSKDVIIVNGANHYCHELEAIVEQVSGVTVSYTAACPVTVESGNTGAFCIFFSPMENVQGHVAGIIQAIRAHLNRTTGLSPAFVVPLEKGQIPKTAIGKIQRAELRSRFERGDFHSIVKQIEIDSGVGDVVPDWFFEPVWRPRRLTSTASGELSGTYLVFADERGLAAEFARRVELAGGTVISVRPGREFQVQGANSYRINPEVREEYAELARRIASRGTSVDTVLHCWSYSERAEGVDTFSSSRSEQAKGIYGLLHLVGALERATIRPKRLFVVSRESQPVQPDDGVVSARSAAAAFLQTLAVEADWMQCRHLDLLAATESAAVDCLVAELSTRRSCVEVAYRNHIRYEPCLERANMLAAPAHNPIVPGGLYLITGGLGGIGTELARYLLAEYRIKALLVGSTVLPPESEWSSLARGTGVLAARIRNYRAIQATGGECLYRPVDLRDGAALQEAVKEAENRWGSLQGVFHLAGELNLKRHWDVMDRHWIRNESVDTFEWMFAPKALGTRALFRLLEYRPGTLFVAFSSVNSLFGGATFSAYSAANRYMDSCCIEMGRRSGIHTCCLNWSMWDNTGMSADSPTYGRQAARDMGYQIVGRRQGLLSTMAAIGRNRPQLVIGVDAANPQIRKQIRQECFGLQTLQILIADAEGPAPEEIATEDCFGLPCRFNCERVSEEELGNGASLRAPGASRIAPRTPAEETIARLWSEILSAPNVGVTDRFFDLGGDSLLALRLVNRLRDTFRAHISLRTLLEHPTVEELAMVLPQLRGSESELPRDLSDLDRFSDEEVDSLLRELSATRGERE